MSLFNCVFIRTSQVSVNGTLYKEGCVLALRAEEDEPVFGTVESIYVFSNQVVFHVQLTELVEFNSHFNCYILSSSAMKEYMYVSHSSLLDFVPLHKKVNPSITLDCSHFVVVPKSDYLLLKKILYSNTFQSGWIC